MLLDKQFLITVIYEIYDVVCASYETIARLKPRIKSKGVSFPFFLISNPFELLFPFLFFLFFRGLLRPYRVLAYILHSQLSFELGYGLPLACSGGRNGPFRIDLSETFLFLSFRRLKLICTLLITRSWRHVIFVWGYRRHQERILARS